MHTSLKSGVAVFGAALLTSGLAPSAMAQAEGDFYCVCSGSVSAGTRCEGGEATFDADGEILRIKDSKADGKSVSVRWHDHDDVHWYQMTSGKGEVVTWNLDMPEGDRLRWFEVCLDDAGQTNLAQCSNPAVNIEP